MPSSPGKMDLSALSGLKKRVLQSVPSTPVEAVPAQQGSDTVLEPEEQAVASTLDDRTAELTTSRQSGVDPESAADDTVAAPDRAHEPAERTTPTVISQEKVEPAVEEHSG